MSCHSDRVSKLVFSFRLDGADWATAELRVGSDSVTLSVSGMTDAPEDLLDAVISLFYGATFSWVSWMEEPDYIRWLFFQNSDDTLGVRVIRANDGDPVFVSRAHTLLDATLDLREVGEAVSVGMDAMLAEQTDAEYHERWGRSEAGSVRSRVAELRSLLRDGPTHPAPQRLYRKVKPGHMDFGGWDSNLEEQQALPN
jgi:hypothetical protein